MPQIIMGPKVYPFKVTDLSSLNYTIFKNQLPDIIRKTYDGPPLQYEKIMDAANIINGIVVHYRSNIDVKISSSKAGIDVEIIHPPECVNLCFGRYLDEVIVKTSGSSMDKWIESMVRQTGIRYKGDENSRASAASKSI